MINHSRLNSPKICRSVSTDRAFSSAEHGHLHSLDVELHERASSTVEGWRKLKLIQGKDRDLLDPTGASGSRGHRSPRSRQTQTTGSEPSLRARPRRGMHDEAARRVRSDRCRIEA